MKWLIGCLLALGLSTAHAAVSGLLQITACGTPVAAVIFEDIATPKAHIGMVSFDGSTKAEKLVRFDLLMNQLIKAKIPVTTLELGAAVGKECK